MTRSSTTYRRWRTRAAAMALLALSGCAAGPARVPQAVPDGLQPVGTMTPEAVQRLRRLHIERSVGGNDGDYVLGPGDVIAVRAFDFEEMNLRARVDGDGTITLPLVEKVPAANRAVSDLQADLTRRLGEYMYDPHISLFVEEYRSQQVAVVGAVAQPGLVNQTSQKTTIRDVLSSAGGLTATASTRVYFIPAENRGSVQAQAAALGLSSTNGAGAYKPAGDAIMVDTNEADVDTQRIFFGLPVRGGDVLVVPSTGHFIADGWFVKPGTYPARSGLTLRGAIATAGGLTFPARRGRIRLFQPSPDGEIAMREVNYDDIAAQRVPDVYIHEGDVIEVSSSPAKLVPYAFYRVITDLIKVGAGIKVVP